jgi:hypothetical protein
MAAGCVHQLIALEPIRALAFAFGAGAIIGWVETVEQREFMDRLG